MGSRGGNSPLGTENGPALRIAVIGGGIAGMAAAWLLSRRHEVVLYEREPRPGGHSNTVAARTARGVVPVDTGFIVYNEENYPNLTALFRHLGVATRASDMSFSASVDGGAFEYAGGDWRGLFGQPRNALRPRFWSMLRDLLRFYREAPALVAAPPDPVLTLRRFLEAGCYGAPFVRDHLAPMAAAIWSSDTEEILDFPAAAFVRFFHAHGLLRLHGRPRWRTVTGGSREYVRRLLDDARAEVRLSCPAVAVRREPGRVIVADGGGGRAHFDRVVIATQADTALDLLLDPDASERAVLGAFRYRPNRTVLHDDPSLMPRRRRVWASWNHVAGRSEGAPWVTYWMNRLQGIDPAVPLFVTLGAPPTIRPDRILAEFEYRHPVFDAAALAAQPRMADLQGRRRTWFCGSYLGWGFHEDALASGLAAAEAAGGMVRPWHLPARRPHAPDRHASRLAAE